jgi:hypothetical protein
VGPLQHVTTLDTKRTKSMDLTEIAPADLITCVSYSLELHRRCAVDLLRVASALCPAR